MNQLIESLKQRFKSGEMHIKLIMVNVAFFVAVLLISIIFKFGNSNFDFYGFYSSSSDISSLLWKPWSVITYMFSHSLDGIGHIFWNMFVLYFVGNLFIKQLGNKKLLSVYLIGGFVGYLFFVLGYSFLPAFQGTGTLVGASASVTAILVAIGVYTPNFEIRIPFVSQPIKLIYIVGIYVLLDLIRLQSSIGMHDANSGGWMAHLGGAFMGYLVISQLQKGNDWSKSIVQFVDWAKGLFSRQPKMNVSYKSEKKAPRKPKKTSTSSSSSAKKSSTSQEEIDAILDKISEKGYDALSKDEKQKLFNASNK